jgi:hypothetical protein
VIAYVRTVCWPICTELWPTKVLVCKPARSCSQAATTRDADLSAPHAAGAQRAGSPTPPLIGGRRPVEAPAVARALKARQICSTRRPPRVRSCGPDRTCRSGRTPGFRLRQEFQARTPSWRILTCFSFSHSRRRRILLKINDLCYSAFANIKPIESMAYAF